MKIWRGIKNSPEIAQNLVMASNISDLHRCHQEHRLAHQVALTVFVLEGNHSRQDAVHGFGRA